MKKTITFEQLKSILNEARKSKKKDNIPHPPNADELPNWDKYIELRDEVLKIINDMDKKNAKIGEIEDEIAKRFGLSKDVAGDLWCYAFQDRDESRYNEIYDYAVKLGKKMSQDQVEKALMDKFDLDQEQANSFYVYSREEFYIEDGELQKYKGKGRNVVIPDGVTSIGDEAFYDCSGLTSITIPNSVTSIKSSAFYGCNELTSVTIGNGVTSIGNWAFSRCSGLTSITIPDSVTRIGSYAFNYCEGLTSITIPASVKSIGGGTFDNCAKLAHVKIFNPTLFKSTIQDPDKSFEQTPWAEKVKNGNITFDTDKETGTLSSYTGVDTSVSIPADVTTIGVGAFSGNDIIGTVIIPDTVSVISANAFANCSSLTRITLGSGVKRIEKDAFKNVSDNITIYVPDFDMCKLLLDSGLPDSATVIIGKGSSRRRLSWDPEK